MLSFTFFDSAEWTTGEISLDRNPEDIQYENDVLCAATKRASTVIDRLNKKVLNQQKELANLNKVLEKERKRNKELEELYSGAQKDVSMLNLKVMELNEGVRNSNDLTWKEKYDELNKKYTADSTSLNAMINELRRRLKDNNNQTNITCKKLADDLTYITDRCTKAEHTIEAIKEVLIDGDYIRGIEQLSRRRNDK